MKRIGTSYISGLILILACQAPADDTIPITPGEYITGSIASGLSNAYSFQADAGDTVTILLGGSASIGWPVSFSAHVELLGPDGTAVATASGAGSAAIAARSLPQTGTYLVVVRAGYYTGTYALTVIKNPGPNTGDPDGGDMAPGERRTGTIKMGDLDAFAFWANKGDTATILMRGGATDPSIVFYPQVELLSPDGTVTATAQGYSSFAGHMPAAITDQPLPQTGTYLAIVRDHYGIYPGSYDLSLHREPPALTETVVFQRAAVHDAKFTGDLTGTVDSNDLELVRITTGSFAGQGFSRGVLRLNLDGATYAIEWGGVLFTRPLERRVYLKGAISGEFLGTVEGYLTESTPESGIYDQYQATWKIRPADTPTMSGTITVSGTLSYGSPVEVPKTPIHVLQNNLSITADGDYDSISLGAVVTSLKVIRPDNPSTLDGFSTISFTSKSGSGQAWTYDVQTPSGTTEAVGLITDPFFGVLSGTRDDQNLLRLHHLAIHRVDLELPPMADLEVDLSTPRRVSPGQTFEYLIEYRNQGLMTAYDTAVAAQLPYDVNYVSCSSPGVYRPMTHEVVWRLGDVPPSSRANLRVTTTAKWGLPGGTELKAVVRAGTSSPEKDGHAEPNLSPFDIQRYVKYVPRELSEAEFITETELLDLLSSDPQLRDMHEFGEELGAVDASTSVRLRFTDGSETIVVPMTSRASNEVVLVLELSDPQSASLLMRFDGSGVSLLNRQGGFAYDSTTDALAFWGEPGGCTWAQCMAGCLAKRAGEWLRDEILDEILNELTGGLWQILKSGAPCLGWIGSLQCCTYAPNCTYGVTQEQACNDASNFAVECLRSLPLVGQVVDTEDCMIECLFDKHAYAGPDGTCTDPTNGDKGGPTVAGAHDPNRKFGPQGNVVAGQQLDYRVEYENEGGGIAFAVFFTDTLDPSLDESTLKIGPVVDVDTGKQIGGVGTYNPETRTIVWLVGQVDPGQGGYADFSVSVRSDAPVGTEIINVGTVYFPSVPEETKTNAIISTIVAADSINAQTSASLKQLSLLAMAWLEPDRMDAGW